MKSKLLLPLLLFLVSCNADKLFNKGSYQDAFNIAIRKVERKPNDAHHLEIAKKSHLKLIEKEEADIVRLHEIHTSTALELIVRNIEQMDSRQKSLQSLPIPPKKFAFQDYTERLETAKKNAANAYFQDAENLMRENTTKAAQEAYENYIKVKYFDHEFTDIDAKMTEAKMLGTVHILYQVENPNNLLIPSNAMENMQNLRLDRMSKDWVVFHEVYEPQVNYEYIISLSIVDVYVSDEMENKRQFDEKKKVVTRYVKKVDSEGKETEEPVYEEVVAKVQVHEQSKSSRIDAELKILQTYNGDIILTRNISGNEQFKNEYGIYKGNAQALSSKSEKIVKNKAKRYPSDNQLINQAASQLGSSARMHIHLNRKMLNQAL